MMGLTLNYGIMNIWICSTLFWAINLCSPDSSAGESSKSISFKEVVLEWYDAKQYEFALTRLAAQRCTQDEIQQLTEDILHCHRQFEQIMMQTAYENGFTLPIQLGDQDQKYLAQFKTVPEEDFPRAYLLELNRLYLQFEERTKIHEKLIKASHTTLHHWLQDSQETWVTLRQVSQEIIVTEPFTQK